MISSQPPTKAALFDMDGTLVSKNTAWLFSKMRARQGEQSLGLQLRSYYWFFSYLLGFLDAPEVARKALASYRGMAESHMRTLCALLFEKEIRDLISPAARAEVERHRSDGDLLVIITASSPYIAELLAKELKISCLICSELELDNAACFTGDIIEPLCFGDGKVEKLQHFLKSHQLNLKDCTFYSDSITDAPLLSAVANPQVIDPDFRLKRLAKKRQWVISGWRKTLEVKSQTSPSNTPR